MRGPEPAPALPRPPGLPRASCSSPSATWLFLWWSALSPPSWGLPFLRESPHPSSVGVGPVPRIGGLLEAGALGTCLCLGRFSCPACGLLRAADQVPAPLSSLTLPSLKESMEPSPLSLPGAGSTFFAPGGRGEGPPAPLALPLLPEPGLLLPLPARLPPGHPPAFLSGLRVRVPGWLPHGWGALAPC